MELAKFRKKAIVESGQAMGIAILKDKQLEAIDTLFVGTIHTYVSLPTGYGKSII